MDNSKHQLQVERICKQLRTQFRASPELSPYFELEDNSVRLLDHPRVWVNVGPDYVTVDWEDSLGTFHHDDDPKDLVAAVKAAIAAQKAEAASSTAHIFQLRDALKKSYRQMRGWKNTAAVAEIMYGLCPQLYDLKVSTLKEILEYLVKEINKAK